MDDYKIFICAHKPIENEIPKGKEYVIVAQNKTIEDKNHQIIYLDNDEFTKKHWRCYGEGCAMRYLWKHPELLSDYVGIAHYRRFFLSLIGKEYLISKVVNKCGAIIMNPFIHKGKTRYDNWSTQCVDHFEQDATILRQIVHEVNPEFGKVYEEMLVDDKQYACNMFVMKKEHFLEMCEICFGILDEFDKRTGFVDNDKVYKEIIHRHRTQFMVGGVAWQARMQGFYLEWLTDTYYRYKFDVKKCKKLNIGLPNNNSVINTYNRN